jgi:hypothetical protein
MCSSPELSIHNLPNSSEPKSHMSVLDEEPIKGFLVSKGNININSEVMERDKLVKGVNF